MGALRELSVLRPARFVGLVAVDWLLILLAAGAAVRWPQQWVIVAAVLVIGSRQHAFFILMHDATHFRGLRQRSHNDLLANLLLAWPLGFTVQGYRSLHLAHHRWTNGDGDPDFARRVDNPEWRFPATRAELGLLFLRDLSGLSVLVEKAQWFRAWLRDVAGGRLRLLIPTPLFLGWTVVLVAAWWLGLLLPVVLWFVAMATWTEGIVRLRNISEHFGLPQKPLIHPTRTVLAGRWTSWALGLHHANYHVEHHLFPSVPLGRLPALREQLSRDPDYLARTHTSHGYRAVLRECMASPAADAGKPALTYFDGRADRW